jgi:ABC-2 type transport system ATP-binding protein
MSVLHVKNLVKTFKSGLWPFTKLQTHTAVNNVSFDLTKGEILGLLGPNGAGKTTIIQMLSGILTPSSGVISYFGLNFIDHPILSLKRIGCASGYDRLPARLTVIENLDIVSRTYGMNNIERKQRLEELLNAFGIEHLRNRQMGTLSAGQTTRVMLAKAFIPNPEIVLLDEPTASLDPDVAYEVRAFILQQRKNRGTSILITSHNMSEVTELCDRVLVLKNGTIIANNTPEKLAESSSRIHLTITISSNLDYVIHYLLTNKLIYTQQDNHLTIELDEHSICELLSSFGEHKVFYSHISIDKPTLEDYFLSIAKNQGRS